MSWVIRAKHLYRRFRDPNTTETELDEEIRSYFDTIVDRRMSQGLTREEAQRAARLDFGNSDQVKERVREARIGAAVDATLQDMRYALRGMRRRWGFTLTAVATVAVSVGMNTAVFTLAAAMLFKGYPNVEESDRIVFLQTRHTSDPAAAGVSYLDLLDWRAQAKSFSGIAVIGGDGPTNLSDKGGPASYYATRISANGFQVIGQRPILGRDFALSDDIPGAAPVMILSYGIWEQRYGKDPAIIGQTVRLDDVPTTVIGVMPRGYAFPFLYGNAHLFVPWVPTSEDLQKREARHLYWAFGRLAKGVSLKTARVEMETIGSQLARAYPATNRDFVPGLQNFNERYVGPDQVRSYETMWGAGGFVLLIACANLSNLMLARAIGRTREISIRIALGAGQWRIIRQLLMESTALSVLGGAFGWWIAKWAVDTYALTVDAWYDFSMDYRVLGYLVAISIGTGILFGLAPARRLSRIDVNASLKEGGYGLAGGLRGRHLSAILMTGEMALSLILLAGAGLMIRSFLNIYTVNVGVKKPENILMVPQLSLSKAKYPDGYTQTSFYNRLKVRLEAIPGVESVAMTSFLPALYAPTFPFEIEGALPGGPAGDRESHSTLYEVVVSQDYFRTLGAAVLVGRDFSDADGTSAVPVAIVNQRLAGKEWRGVSPLGKRLRLLEVNTPGPWLTIVGVASDIIQDRNRQKIDPIVYLPYRQEPRRDLNVVARTRIPPRSLENDFRRGIHALDPGVFVSPTDVQPLTEWLDSYRSYSQVAVVFATFATIALLLAAVGLYAIISQTVRERTQEIGIRIALGATTRDILKLVFRQGMRPVGIGLILGLAASFSVTRFLSAKLVGVSPNDPFTLVVASIVLISAAAFGCLMPARRATRVDPVVALRHQ